MSVTRISPRVFWGALLLVALSVMTIPPSLPAQTEDCKAMDPYGYTRPCTFLEEHGRCLVSALDSYYECWGRGGVWNRTGCFIGVQVDLLACNLGLPFKLIQSILR
ncbi:hypothetical protein ACGF5M_04725 [Gemmatimonadota bacterium]